MNDYSKLEALTANNKKTIQAQFADELSNTREYKNTSEGKKLSESEKSAKNRANLLQREINNIQNDIARSKEICSEHQRNTITAELLQGELLKSIKAGANIYELFLKAVKIISLLTQNRELLTQAESDIELYYGEIYKESGAQQIELREATHRLELLQRAESKERDPENKGRIQAAIRAHKTRIEELTKAAS